MKVIISVLLIIVLLLSLSLTLDESAMQLQDEAFERAMVAFGLAKGLNGVISLIQGTQLSFTPVGIGLNFSVGEVLDPFNDMVERFSWVMLLASISLGVQKLLLILSAKLFLQVVFLGSIVSTLALLWLKQIQNYNYFLVSMKILLFLLVLRFGAVLSVYTTELLYESLLKQEYQTSSLVLEETKTTLEDIQSQNGDIFVENKQSAWYELDVTTKYNNLKEQLNISKKLHALAQNIEEASRKIITLITIFIVQTVLMPLLFLWLLVISIRLIFRTKVDDAQLAVLLR